MYLMVTGYNKRSGQWQVLVAHSSKKAISCKQLPSTATPTFRPYPYHIDILTGALKLSSPLPLTTLPSLHDTLPIIAVHVAHCASTAQIIGTLSS